jgi:hypothetical protein
MIVRSRNAGADMRVDQVRHLEVRQQPVKGRQLLANLGLNG